MADSAQRGSDAGSLRWLIEAIAEAPAELNERLGAGMLVGRYRLVESIGRGGFGVVFKAVDTELGREIALKLLGRSRRGSDAETRLMREAQAMARLSHPNVITIYDVGAFEGGVFIAMELVHGGTLTRWMKEARPWRQVIEVFVRAGRGLEAAHRAGLVHRDFKPDNVLVGSDGRVHVTDFGVARMMDSGEAAPSAPVDSALGVSLTRTGMLLGTPAYMAPEQMNGEASDVRADVFSFCVALYEALYRERPFAGGELPALKEAVAAGRIAAPPRKTDVPARVRRVLVRGLRASPAERHQTMGELLADLEAAARAERRRRFLVAGAVGLAALAAGAGGFVRLAPSRDPPREAPAAPPVAPPAPVTAPAPTPAPAIAAAPAPPRGTIVVRVNVEAARIELDGQVVAESAGTARITVEPAREHRLRVSAPGYRAAQKHVRVGPDATVETAVSLVRSESRKPPPTPPPAARAPAAPLDPNAVIDPYRTPR